MPNRPQKPNIFSPNPKLRTMAEAAYLVNQVAFYKYSADKLVTKETYENTVNNGGYFNSLREERYEFLDVLDNKKDGFYATALRNRNEEILVSIRGTDFSNFNLLGLTFVGLFGQKRIAENLIERIISGDLHNDFQILLGKVPDQYKSAESFIDDVLKNYPDNRVTITGHSLGGLLSQLVSAKFGVETVVFDSPGAKKTIEKLVGDDFDQQKITIINDLPNFINAYGEHIKTPIAVNNGGVLSLGVVHNFLETFPHKPGKKAQYLLSHGMEDILNSISEDGFFEQIPIEDWPKNVLAFYNSMEAYNVMPDVYDRCIYQIWKKQYERKSFVPSLIKIRKKYPTFESYKKYFLEYKLTKNKELSTEVMGS
jgi:pimeloyl-ACP methyl ester carboxylesterase